MRKKKRKGMMTTIKRILTKRHSKRPKPRVHSKKNNNSCSKSLIRLKEVSRTIVKLGGNLMI